MTTLPHALARTRARRAALAALAFVAALLLAPTSARSHAPRPPEPFNLDLALTLLSSAYTSAVTEEFVEVSVRRGVASPARESLIIRIDPGSRTRPASCRMELNELSVYWSKGDPPAGRLIAVHDRDLTSLYTAPIDAALTVRAFADALLPVPAPQLSLALEPDVAGKRTMPWLTPYTPSVTWTDASKDPRRAPADIVVSGTCEPLTQPLPGEPALRAGKASMTIDENTGRLKRLFFEIDGGKIELELRMRPERSKPRAEWPIAAEGRTPVKEVSELRPRKGDALVAKKFPDLVMQDLKERIWLPGEAFAVLPPDPVPAELALVLIREVALVANAPAGAPVTAPANLFDHAAARAALASLRAINTQRVTDKDPARRAPIAAKVVLVLDQPDDHAREKIAAGAKEWSAGGAAASAEVVWCSNAASSIERFAPDATAAIVILKPDLSVCAVIPLRERDAPDAEKKAALERDLRAGIECKQPEKKDALPPKP